MILKFQYLEPKTYGTHHLDSVIGHPEHLDHALNAVRDLEIKNYGAHHLDSVIGHPEHLEHALV